MLGGERDVENVLKHHKNDSQRKMVLKSGTISFRGTSVACVVLNISNGGAGLVVESDVAIPFMFDLAIDGEPVRRRCQVVWRIECRIGVLFDFGPGERAQNPAID